VFGTMKNKFNKFMAFATLCILLAGFVDYKISEYDSNLNEYILTDLEYNELLEKGIVRHCVKEDTPETIKMSEGGYGEQCGIQVQELTEDCIPLFTWGEEINYSEEAKKRIERYVNKPKSEVNILIVVISVKSAKSLRFLLMSLALIFTAIAIVNGFKWEELKPIKGQP